MSTVLTNKLSYITVNNGSYSQDVLKDNLSFSVSEPNIKFIYNGNNYVNAEIFSFNYTAVTTPVSVSATDLMNTLNGWLSTSYTSPSNLIITGITITNFISGNTISVNLISATTLSATTMSGGTIYSGSTEMSTLFASVSSIINYSPQLNTKVNKSGDTMTGQLTGPSISATTISGGTIYSGGTDLFNIFISTISQTIINFGGIRQVEYNTGVTISDSSITSSSKVMVCLSAEATNDHTSDEVMIENVMVSYGNLNPGVGFDILAYCPDGTYGQYKVNYQVKY